MDFCGEIMYDRGYDENGNQCEDYWVHSDICFHCGLNEAEEISDEYREFLHKCLDEWLDKAKGTGAFWIGDTQHLLNEFKEQEQS